MPSSIYVWDGISTGIDTEISLAGNVGALFVDNGINYVFYEDVTSSNGYKLGYVYGNSVKELCSFPGSLPQNGQVTKYRNFIIWPAGEKIWAFGSTDRGMSTMIFQLADGGYSTLGALAAPFGTPMIASYDGGTSYKLAKLYGYDTSCYWYSLMIPTGKSTLKDFTVYCDPITSGGRADFTIVRDNGAGSYSGFTLNETTLTSKNFNIGAKLDNNFRIQISWAQGSATYPVRINRIEFNVLKDND